MFVLLGLEEHEGEGPAELEPVGRGNRREPDEGRSTRLEREAESPSCVGDVRGPTRALYVVIFSNSGMSPTLPLAGSTPDDRAIAEKPSRRLHPISRQGGLEPLPLGHDCHMNNYYALINKLTAKPGKRQEVIQNLIDSGKAFQDNPACILYLVYEDAEDPNVIWVEDVWTSKEEHATALKQPELQPYIGQTVPLLEGMPDQTEVVPVGGKAM